MRAFPLYLLLVTLLSSCALFERQPEEAVQWQAHQKRVQAINNWYLEGKISVSNEVETVSFSIQWQQTQPGHFDMYLSGPLGQGAVTIKGQPGYVVAKHPDGDLQAASLTQLLDHYFDLQLPMDSLLFWLKGVNHPNSKYRYGLDVLNLPLWIEQDGWRIDYSSYHDMMPPLPRKLTLKKDQQSGKVVVKVWQI